MMLIQIAVEIIILFVVLFTCDHDSANVYIWISKATVEIYTIFIWLADKF